MMYRWKKFSHSIKLEWNFSKLLVVQFNCVLELTNGSVQQRAFVRTFAVILRSGELSLQNSTINKSRKIKFFYLCNLSGIVQVTFGDAIRY